LSIEGRTEGWEKRIDDSMSCILVFVSDQKVHGFIAGGKCRDSDLEGWNEIYAIYVDPEAQRQGIGRALANAFEEHLPVPCALWVFAENQPAADFYRSIGFRESETSKDITIDGKELKEIRYVRGS